jgi:hypothetical protein
MNLAFWLPFTFALGLAGMIVCYVFLRACEQV